MEELSAAVKGADMVFVTCGITVKNRVLIRQILSAIDILNFYLDLRYDIRKNTNTKKDRK